MTSDISTAQDIELTDADIADCEVIVSSAGNKLEGEEPIAEGNKGRRKCLCLFCVILLLAIILCLYFLWPKRVQVCVKLQFGMDVLSKLDGDEGTYDIEVKNSNYYALEIQNLEFGAYYGERIEDEQVLNAQINDWHIGSLKSSLRNENYVYTQTFAHVVPSAEIIACFRQMVDSISFNVSAKMTGCMLGSCVDIENDELVYVLNCVGEGQGGCLDYTKKIF